MPPTSKRNWTLGYDMWMAGDSQAAIAAAMGCTRAAVRQWAVRHGWPERTHERRTIIAGVGDSREATDTEEGT